MLNGIRQRVDEPAPSRMSDDWSQPWFDAVRGGLRAVGADALGGRWQACLEWLDACAIERGLVNENGQPLRFVDARSVHAQAYEEHIWRTGQVPTRTGASGAWHDLLNALVWLAFPATKARLNRLQAQAIAAHGIGSRRGGLRDAATLFDENAVLFVTRDPDFAGALRRFEWRALFVDGRQRFARDVHVIGFGHALLDKLRRPYKAVCAHAWVIAGEEPWARVAHAASAGAQASLVEALDRPLAGTIDAESLRPDAFCPLPVLGIPGWWAANARPGFYDDAAVFRAGRARGTPATGSA